MGNEIMTRAATDVAPKSPSLPRAAISASTKASEYVAGRGVVWTARAALTELGERRTELPAFVDTARSALAPAPAKWLSDRLSGMQLAMTQGWSVAKATAWLHETQRLLADVPQDILDRSLDEAVKTGRGFLPSVGEIRAMADPRIAERRTLLARLEAMARQDAAAGTPEPEQEPACAPEDAAAICAEFGIGRGREAAPPSPRQRSPDPSLAEYLALGLSEQEARDALAERARILTNAVARSIAGAVADAARRAAA